MVATGALEGVTPMATVVGHRTAPALARLTPLLGVTPTLLDRADKKDKTDRAFRANRRDRLTA